MDIGALIRTLRQERGISQAALAKAVGTSQPAIARLEAGHVSPSLTTVERILQALGLRLELVTAEVDTGVDLTLIAQMLRLSPPERLAKLAQEHSALAGMERAMRTRSA